MSSPDLHDGVVALDRMQKQELRRGALGVGGGIVHHPNGSYSTGSLHSSADHNNKNCEGGSHEKSVGPSGGISLVCINDNNGRRTGAGYAGGEGTRGGEGQSGAGEAGDANNMGICDTETVTGGNFNNTDGLDMINIYGEACIGRSSPSIVQAAAIGVVGLRNPTTVASWETNQTSVQAAAAAEAGKTAVVPPAVGQPRDRVETDGTSRGRGEQEAGNGEGPVPNSTSKERESDTHSSNFEKQEVMHGNMPSGGGVQRGIALVVALTRCSGDCQ